MTDGTEQDSAGCLNDKFHCSVFKISNVITGLQCVCERHSFAPSRHAAPGSRLSFMGCFCAKVRPNRRNAESFPEEEIVLIFAVRKRRDVSSPSYPPLLYKAMQVPSPAFSGYALDGAVCVIVTQSTNRRRTFHKTLRGQSGMLLIFQIPTRRQAVRKVCSQYGRTRKSHVSYIQEVKKSIRMLKVGAFLGFWVWLCSLDLQLHGHVRSTRPRKT